MVRTITFITIIIGQFNNTTLNTLTTALQLDYDGISNDELTADQTMLG